MWILMERQQVLYVLSAFSPVQCYYINAQNTHTHTYEYLLSLIHYSYIVFFLKFLIGRSVPKDFVRLDQDILSPLAGKKKLYTHETLDFWEQIKTPG